MAELDVFKLKSEKLKDWRRLFIIIISCHSERRFDLSPRPRSIKGEQIGSEMRRALVDLSKSVSAEPAETGDSERDSDEMGLLLTHSSRFR